LILKFCVQKWTIFGVTGEGQKGIRPKKQKRTGAGISWSSTELSATYGRSWGELIPFEYAKALAKR